MSSIATAFKTSATEIRRTPILLALFVVAPAYVIYVFMTVAPEGPAVVHLKAETIRTTLPKAFPAFSTPMTAALLTGITGLFLMQTAQAADSRLVVAGYRAHELILARLLVLAGVATTATAVSVGVMLTAFRPERLGWFLLGTGLAALLYGIIGMLVGVFLDRLPGVYLIMFGSMIDLFIFQNPLATDTPALATVLPGHYPLELLMKAGFAGSVDPAALGWTLGYLAALGLLAIGGLFLEME